MKAADAYALLGEIRAVILKHVPPKELPKVEAYDLLHEALANLSKNVWHKGEGFFSMYSYCNYCSYSEIHGHGQSCILIRLREALAQYGWRDAEEYQYKKP